MAQFFVGQDTLVCDAYGIKTQKQFIDALYDNIRFRGAMTTLITDGGRYEISKKVADLLRSLFIKQHESEPYHQHQNKAEQRYGVVKRYINTLMNLTGAPAHCWLLCMLYVCHLLNATASPALGGLTPLQALTGQVPDISHSLHFSFWEPIYYRVDESEPDQAPLVGGDHPESDTSDFCDQDQTKQYQTIVGQLIWLAGLGRFDIAVHVMTMSRFRQQPRIGHFERLKKIVGYLANFPHGALRFRLHEPDYSSLPHKDYDWQRTVYEGAKEEIPHDIPEPKGKYVTTTTYVDANLHHDQVTGKAVTACLHMVNATPSHWYTKRQATVETATYGS